MGAFRGKIWAAKMLDVWVINNVTGTAVLPSFSAQYEVLKKGSMMSKSLPKKPKHVLKASLVEESEDGDEGGGRMRATMNDKTFSHVLLRVVTRCPKERIS